MQNSMAKKQSIRYGSKGMEYLAVCLVGGIGYGLLETLWRGYTHFSMVITGGVCLLVLYRHNKRHREQGTVCFCLVCMLVITMAEFLAGVVVNLWLGWQVWDYSALRFNLLGQICLPYSLLWFSLGIPIRLLCQGLQKLFA